MPYFKKTLNELTKYLKRGLFCYFLLKFTFIYPAAVPITFEELSQVDVEKSWNFSEHEIIVRGFIYSINQSMQMNGFYLRSL
jgi:hypothetical protein